jgi:hypothetical protein
MDFPTPHWPAMPQCTLAGSNPQLDRNAESLTRMCTHVRASAGRLPQIGAHPVESVAGARSVWVPWAPSRQGPAAAGRSSMGPGPAAAARWGRPRAYHRPAGPGKESARAPAARPAPPRRASDAGPALREAPSNTAQTRTRLQLRTSSPQPARGRSERMV